MVRKNRPFYHLRLGHEEGKNIKKQQKIHKHQEISYYKSSRLFRQISIDIKLQK